MSDNKPSITPQITRTNSVFPASNYTGYIFPVIDPRSGQVVNYRDQDGHLTDQSGTRLNTDKRAAEEAAKAAAEAKAKGIAGYQHKVVAAQELRNKPLTLDGIEQKPFGMTIQPDGVTVEGAKITDENGNDISWSRRGQIAAQRSRAAAVFSGLNLSDVEASATFVMSRGTADVIDPVTGEKVTPKPVNDMDSVGARARRDQAAHQPKPETQQNLMSIQEGVRWLRQLSVKDPGTYNQMVVRLRNAGYINGKDEDLPMNGWSDVVGDAFAYAAKDLSGAAQDGETRTLAEWLDARGKNFADSMAEATAYHPVDRHFTDPAALEASARAAAEQALGRGLTDAEAARFAAHFKGLESANYDQIDAAGRAKGSASVTDPNAAGQAEAYVRGPEFNADRAKQLVGSYMDSFKSLVGL